jgi:uncharacterized protein
MWYQIREHNILLFVKAKPRAKRTAIIGCKANCLEIALQALPAEGNANQALLAFLGELFAIPKTNIAIAHGLHGRVKRIILPNEKSILAKLQMMQQQLIPC